jgi:hypothetical protein
MKVITFPLKTRAKIWMTFHHPVCMMIGHMWGNEELFGEITKRTCIRCGVFELSDGVS